MKDIRFINDSKTTYINEVRVIDGNITHTVPVIRCAAYRDEKWISHGFSTRLGGVSAGIYGSLNLSFSQGDEESWDYGGCLRCEAGQTCVFPPDTHDECAARYGGACRYGNHKG